MPSSSTSRFTELPADPVPPTAHELEARTLARTTLSQTLQGILVLGQGTPLTDVGRLVRDGGVFASVLRMAVAVGWDDTSSEDDPVQKPVMELLESCVKLSTSDPEQTQVDHTVSLAGFHPHEL